MDNIGLYKGKSISKMTRKELLDFATWAGKEILRLQQIENATEDYRIDQEIEQKYPRPPKVTHLSVLLKTLKSIVK